MSYSEKILEELMRLAEANRTGLFEAAADYCDDHDLDQEEFIETLDSVIIQRLKADAISERRIRKCIQKPTATLF